MYASSDNSSNTTNEKNLTELYSYLRSNEFDWLPVHSYSCDNIPIVDKNSIPKHFIPTNFPECINFPLIRVNPDELLNGLEGVGGLSQIISSVPDDHFDECMLSMDENTENVLSSKAKDNPYSELMPYFKEMTAHMNGYCMDNDFVEIKKFFQHQVAKFKEIANRNLPFTNSMNQKKHPIISSSIPTSKKRKAHDTKHFK